MCEIRSYSIRRVPGTPNAILSGDFVCSIDITPPSVTELVGNRLELSCNVLRNIDVTVRFSVENGAFNILQGDLVQDQSSLEFVRESATEAESGTYQCLATSVIGGISTQEGSVVEILRKFFILC